MAFKIPSYEEHVAAGTAGAVPRLQPVEQYDFGRDISRAGAEMDRAYSAYQQSVKETGETDALKAAAELRMSQEQAFHTARETARPGAERFTPDFLENFNNAVNSVSENLTSEEAKTRFREKALSLETQFQARALGFEAVERQRHRVNNFQVAADASASTVFSTDAPLRGEAFNSSMTEFMESLNEVDLEPGQKLELAKAAEAKLSFAAVKGDLRDRPEKVQSWLTDQPGNDYFNKLRGVESGGRNIGSDTSSAFGPFQFTKSTWADLIKAHPEMGLTEADRFKPAAQEIAIRQFTQDNAKVLASIGYKPTSANLYMVHFMGKGGGPKFLQAMKANPQTEARKHVSPEAVAANPTIFREGRSLQDVYSIFARKFGMTVEHDADNGAPAYYSRLTFEHRNALYGQAETEMNRRRTAGAAAFKQRVDNSLAEAANTGSASDVPSEGEFLAAFGDPERGEIAYGDFRASYQAAEATYKVQRMSLGEMSEYAEQFNPQPGDPHYSDKLQGYNAVRNVVSETQKRVRDDFGAHLVAINPDAGQALAETMGEDAEQAAVAAKRYVSLADSEAARLGFRTDDLLPKSSVDAISAMLDQKLRTPDNAAAAVAGLNAVKARWGDDWPRIHQAIKNKLSPAVHVLTADGIAPQVATLLASVHDKSYEDLSKVMIPPEKQELSDTLSGDFVEYAQTEIAGQSDTAAFFGQAKKLAAIYAAQGVSPDDAADRAYAELIGNRFVFDGKARIPKNQEAIVARLEGARMQALEGVDLSSLPPGVDEADARSWYSSTTEWRTLPDNRGLILMEAGRVVRDKAGNVIARTWVDLAKTELPAVPRAASDKGPMIK